MRLTVKHFWTRDLALRLLAEFGLDDWEFRFNANRRRMGACFWPHRSRPGRIEVSVHTVELNEPAEVEDTIRHEIAHALAGPTGGHGPAWQAACELTGAVPERTSIRGKMPLGPWQARCPGCGFNHNKMRRPRILTGWHCVFCGLEKGPLTWGLRSV